MKTKNKKTLKKRQFRKVKSLIQNKKYLNKQLTSTLKELEKENQKQNPKEGMKTIKMQQKQVK